METRLPTSANVATSTSTPRVTPTQPKVPFAEIMGQTAVVGAEAAMRVLPGGPVMAAALRSGAAPAVNAAAPMQSMSQPLATPALTAPNAALTASAPTPSVSASSAAEGPAAVAPSGQVGGGSSMNIDGALAQSQEMNLYYLRIQEQVNAENRSFTTMSNVMKAEHETVKTAIGNIR